MREARPINVTVATVCNEQRAREARARVTRILLDAANSTYSGASQAGMATENTPASPPATPRNTKGLPASKPKENEHGPHQGKSSRSTG